jgi:putative tryptophan/tyrosine transport system substrate-binding protein
MGTKAGGRSPVSNVKRRDFITLFGGAAVAWPLAARAQQPERMRRIGVLMNLATDDPEGQARFAAFLLGLRELGWSDGRNVRIDTRWAAGDTERFRTYATELVALAPDVILAASTPGVTAVQQATRTVPIVFVTVFDPVSASFVSNLARPGGNTTGFALSEYGTSAKWLELLKQIAPDVTRVAVIWDPTLVSGTGQLAAIQAVAPSLGVELSPIDVRDAGEIERTIAALARSANGGLIVTGSPTQATQRKLIMAQAARHRLPAIYAQRFNVADGGLISYGPDSIDPYRRAATYVDRILKGEKPGSLPVQAPVKYELVINLATAKELGLEIPPTLLALAAEVIE